MSSLFTLVHFESSNPLQGARLKKPSFRSSTLWHLVHIIYELLYLSCIYDRKTIALKVENQHFMTHYNFLY